MNVQMTARNKHPEAVKAWNESRTVLCQECGGSLDWTPTEDDLEKSVENPFSQLACGTCVSGGLEKGTYMLPEDFFGAYQLKDAEGNLVEITDAQELGVS